MKRKSNIYRILLLIFVAMFLLSAYMVYSISAQARREQQTFAELEEIVRTSIKSELKEIEQNSAQTLPDTAPSNEMPETNESISPYIVLKEMNPDFFGWLSIEGTKLNYPVMHTPEDGEYYLRRDFEGSHSESGVPFMAANCYEGCGNYLIYGHHMKNGTMFGSLLSYADRTYWEEHPVIRFDTLASSGEYEVMAAFYSEAYSQDAEGVFRYYQYTDVSDASVFSDYVSQVQKAALYDTGISAVYGDELLTLSTCSYHTKNGRFVVVARKAGSPQLG